MIRKKTISKRIGKRLNVFPILLEEIPEVFIAPEKIIISVTVVIDVVDFTGLHFLLRRLVNVKIK